MNKFFKMIRLMVYLTKVELGSVQSALKSDYS